MYVPLLVVLVVDSASESDFDKGAEEEEEEKAVEQIAKMTKPVGSKWTNRTNIIAAPSALKLLIDNRLAAK